MIELCWGRQLYTSHSRHMYHSAMNIAIESCSGPLQLAPIVGKYIPSALWNVSLVSKVTMIDTIWYLGVVCGGMTLLHFCLENTQFKYIGRKETAYLIAYILHNKQPYDDGKPKK